MSLECLGYDIGPYGIDGKFGNDTENAVCDFQYDHYLEEDGKVGDNTWNKIKSEISPIQQSLINKGYNVGPCGADGIYGYSTVEAVKKFQSDHNLNVDGIAGKETQEELFREEANNYNYTSDLFNIMAKNYISSHRPSPPPAQNEISAEGLMLLYALKINLDNQEFFSRCNKITSKAFDFLKLDIKIEAYDFTYSYKVGFLKVIVNAKSGGTFSFGGEKYIFKLSAHSKTEGLILSATDFITDKLQTFLLPQIKNNIYQFKQKVS
jgi:hypothetical protein